MAASAARVSRADPLPDQSPSRWSTPTRTRARSGPSGVSRTSSECSSHRALCRHRRPEGMLAAALRLTQRSWMPCVNPWEPAFMHLAEQGAELGCRAVLSGEGVTTWFEAEWYEAADDPSPQPRWALASVVAGAPSREAASETARGLLWNYGARPLLRDATLGAMRHVAGGRTSGRHQRQRALLSFGKPGPCPTSTSTGARRGGPRTSGRPTGRELPGLCERAQTRRRASRRTHGEPFLSQGSRR